MEEVLVAEGTRIQLLIGHPPGPMFPTSFTKAYFDGRNLILTDEHASATALRYYRIGEAEYLFPSRIFPPSQELEVTREILEQRGLKKVDDAQPPDRNGHGDAEWGEDRETE